ncbi:MAG TPA: selenocysteine-specific translation elongation factor [Pyrinomonadaceae bacterium]|nr:selenocysteine-specific translation elongation factor [Pyrinomonadaceae bacterium]
MQSIIIGTAGHIDHGKSALVLALTGKDPDRLPEEKRRGITIDLGFADLDLGNLRVSFVDVPGHERFVKNMLAGVHGLDAVILVIAADEGVMPQTREHFDICRLLGVRRGLVALTKTDLVEPELLSLVQGEAEELIAGSFLDNAPLIPVSARNGGGLDELREAIRDLAKELPARSADFVTKLPVDRVFTMKGFGAVVTGTLVAGAIAPGDELDLWPLGKRVRARGVQVHGHTVERAHGGQRTAVNLAGIDVSDIERGMVLAEVGRLLPTQIVDVQLNLLATAPKGIRSRSRLRVHLGSAEVFARVRVLNAAGEIPPRQSGFAQLRFESPVVAVHGEPFVVRSYSPAATVAGGIVLDPHAAKHRGREVAAKLEQLQLLLDSDRRGKLAVFVGTSGDRGLRLPEVAARTGWTDNVIEEIVKQAQSGANAILNAEGVLIAAETFDRLRQAASDEVKRHHTREPLSRGLARETLRERLFAHAAPELFRAVINRLETDGVVVSEKDVVRAADHARELNSSDKQLLEKIGQVYRAAALEAPTLEQAFERAGINAGQRTHARRLLQLLIDDGTLVRVQPETFFHSVAISQLKTLVREYAAAHEPDRLIDVPKFKELAGISRKYAIPLLEYFDRERVTVRAGDKRVVLR